MSKHHAKSRHNDSRHIHQEVEHLRRELAKVAPPKVENEEFTVVTTI
jgi:hypothetical protein